MKASESSGRPGSGRTGRNQERQSVADPPAAAMDGCGGPGSPRAAAVARRRGLLGEELKERVQGLLAQGRLSRREIAKRVGVNRETVARIAARMESAPISVGAADRRDAYRRQIRLAAAAAEALELADFPKLARESPGELSRLQARHEAQAEALRAREEDRAGGPQVYRSNPVRALLCAVFGVATDGPVFDAVSAAGPVLDADVQGAGAHPAWGGAAADPAAAAGGDPAEAADGGVD